MTVSSLLSRSLSACPTILLGSVGFPRVSNVAGMALWHFCEFLLNLCEFSRDLWFFKVKKMRFSWNGRVSHLIRYGGSGIQERVQTCTLREKAQLGGSGISAKPEANCWGLVHSVMVLSCSSWWRHRIPTAATSWSQRDKALSCFGGTVFCLPGHWASTACAGLQSSSSRALFSFTLPCSPTAQNSGVVSGADAGAGREGVPCFSCFLFAVDHLLCSHLQPAYFWVFHWRSDIRLPSADTRWHWAEKGKALGLKINPNIYQVCTLCPPLC